jgi:hypothetical protein
MEENRETEQFPKLLALDGRPTGHNELLSTQVGHKALPLNQQFVLTEDRSWR